MKGRRKFRTMSPPVLELRSVSKRYGERSIVRDVSFALGTGEGVALLGPSGSGKTTLLNCIGGVDRPDEGVVLIQGIALGMLKPDGLAQVRRHHVGTIFQFFHLLPTLTASENVELPLQLLGMRASERRERVEILLSRVGLAHRASALPSQLSGGEMQRVAIARAIAHRPALILADEPTGNLDSKTGRLILDLLSEVVAETGAALLMVTHSDEAARLCARVLHILDGKVLEQPGALV